MTERTDWKNLNIQVFWGELAAHDHVVQFYENEKVFMNTLEGFAGSGLLSGDCVIVIATLTHLEELECRLKNQRFDLEKMKESGTYIPVDAQAALKHFLVDNWPDQELFYRYVNKLLERSSASGQRIRAFGEMVALLWEQGHAGATVQLEKLWCDIHKTSGFSLYCAYPKSGFTQSPAQSMTHICDAHSRVIDGQSRPATQIYYRESKN